MLGLERIRVFISDHDRGVNEPEVFDQNTNQSLTSSFSIVVLIVADQSFSFTRSQRSTTIETNEISHQDNDKMLQVQ